MEFDLHGLTLVEAIGAYPEQACIIMQKQAMELARRANGTKLPQWVKSEIIYV